LTSNEKEITNVKKNRTCMKESEVLNSYQAPQTEKGSLRWRRGEEEGSFDLSASKMNSRQRSNPNYF
jgi:hypothetical protein